MDNRYSRGKIYKITSEQTDNVYIGSTIQKLNRRFTGHKTDYKNGHNKSSKEIVKYDDARIELIENYPCNSNKELHTRERYYIENTPNTVNKSIPSRTNKQYYEDNREKHNTKCKKYRENNPEKRNITNKKYAENNKDKITAKRHYQNSWGGSYNHYNHNNLLYIDPKLFEK